MFIDSHCHLNMMTDKEESAPLSNIDMQKIEHFCEQAKANNVGKLIQIGSSLHASWDCITIAKKFDSVWAVVGMHPCDCTSNWKEQFKEIKKMVTNKTDNKIVGIGESGLDFFRPPYNEEIQNAAFKSHIELALESNLPIVIHVRNAGDEALKIIQEYIKDGLKGVIHCFSQNADFANQILEWGLYIGIDGHITYPKNDDLRAIIKNIPLDKLLLETDAPFLPPQQFRGKPNSPAYIPLIAQFIATLRNIDIKELEEATTKNTERLFGI